MEGRRRSLELTAVGAWKGDAGRWSSDGGGAWREDDRPASGPRGRPTSGRGGCGGGLKEAALGAPGCRLLSVVAMKGFEVFSLGRWEPAHASSGDGHGSRRHTGGQQPEHHLMAT